MSSSGEYSATLPDSGSFDSVLDNACSRLWDRKVRYTLRRIRELDELLEKTERELDGLLFHAAEGLAASRPVVKGSPVQIPLRDASL
jgi:hypothetical protein